MSQRVGFFKTSKQKTEKESRIKIHYILVNKIHLGLEAVT